MTILYNCHHSGDQYRITKFDPDMNPVSSYLCSLEECDCPRGPHPTCRHRQMLPKFIARQHIGDEWFLDFDRGGWVQMGPEWALPNEIGSHLSGDPTDDLPDGVEKDFQEALSEPMATFIYSTDEPPLEITHVELFKDVPQPAPTHIKRRL